MFKKALQVATAFGILVGAYAGYVRAFALVVERARARQPQLRVVASDGPVESAGSREARELAETKLAPDHWAVNAPVRYYQADRNNWMYAGDYERRNEGRQWRFFPVAIIVRDANGRSTKTITAAEAVLDFDHPVDMARPGNAAARVVHARIEGDVRIRDDKGTPDPADDLHVATKYADYDEASLTIRSVADVTIQDRDFWMTAFNMEIQLRERPAAPDAPPGSVAGFDGAKSATFEKDVHIIVQDVGASGILPGTATAAQAGTAAAAAPGQPAPVKTPTPLDLRCDGRMTIDLPEPPPPGAKPGTVPPRPTIARFARNVRVLRGATNPDNLLSDELLLTLMPRAKPTPAPGQNQGPGQGQAAPAEATASAAASAPAEPKASGPLTELDLREAVATGHAVWLISQSQDMRTKVNRLEHTRPGEGQPDLTVLKADPTARMWVEKLERFGDGPNKGEVESITTIWAAGATIVDRPGEGGRAAHVIATGPGNLETRPAADRPPTRTAEWRDRLEMLTLGEGPQAGRKLTLIGQPKLMMAGDETPEAAPAVGTDSATPEGPTTLQAGKMIVAWLKPKPAPARPAPANADPAVIATAATSGPAAPGGGSYDIEHLVAIEDVRLEAPGRSSTMTAYQRLDARFIAEPAPAAPAPAAPAPGEPPAVAAAPPAPAAPTPEPARPPKPDDPPVDVKARVIYAEIARKGNGGDARMVRLRGDVEFRQDPRPGEEQGVYAAAQAIDVHAVGEGRRKFVLSHRDPAAPKAAPAAPLAGAGDAAAATLARPARVVTPEMAIDGENIELDQSTDFASALGPGRLVMWADRDAAGGDGLGLDARRDADARDPAAPKEKVPVAITWKGEMRFYGQTAHDDGSPGPARADFKVDVRVQTDDSEARCQEMTALLDAPVDFSRSKAAPSAADGDEPEKAPRPQLAKVFCRRDAVVTNRKVDPATGLLAAKHVVMGEDLQFDRARGWFDVDGEGEVWIYDRGGDKAEGGNNGLLPGRRVGSAPAPPSDRRVRLVSDGPRSTARPAPPTPSPNPGAVPSPAQTKAQARPGGAAGRPGANAAAEAPAKPPLQLIRIKFRDGLLGRLGGPVGGEKAEARPSPRRADLFGDIEVMIAGVADEFGRVDFDRQTRDARFLTSQFLRVISEPGPPGAEKEDAHFLDGWENAIVKTYDQMIYADRVTYESRKELFYAQGIKDNVLVVEAKIVGQPPTRTPARAVVFNGKTGQWNGVDMSSLQFIDFKTGGRPINEKPPVVRPLPPKPINPHFRLPGRSDRERRGFGQR